MLAVDDVVMGGVQVRHIEDIAQREGHRPLLGIIAGSSTALTFSLGKKHLRRGSIKRECDVTLHS